MSKKLPPTAEQAAAMMEELGGVGGEVDTLLKNYGEPWGLSVDTIERWFVARKGDTKCAVRDLKAHAEWRKAFMPKGTIEIATIKNELASNKVAIMGYDNDHHPITVLFAAKHKSGDAEETKRAIAFALDCAGRLGRLGSPAWDGKTVGIFDLRGMGLSNCDAGALRAVFDLLQNHYPERLAKLYLHCAPYVFYGLWKLVSPFIDPITREKVVFICEKEAKEILKRDFALEVLPTELGGTGEWTTPEMVYGWMAKGVTHPNIAAAAAAKAGKIGSGGASDMQASGVLAAPIVEPVAA